jgi:hypothetical protein
MADEKQRLPATLFEAVKPDAATAPLIVGSDVLVMMLRIASALRALLLIPAIENSAAAQEIRTTVQDLERRIAATMKAIDELAETQGGKDK